MDQNDKAMLEQVRADLIEMAREISKRGLSYRNFRVGCAMLMWKSVVSGRHGHYGFVTAVNIKPDKKVRKVCAEQTGIGQAQAEGWERAIAIVIAGEPQPDVTGLCADTLLPCDECRAILRSMPQVSDETLIITAHNHQGKVEERTFKEILEFFGEY